MPNIIVEAGGLKNETKEELIRTLTRTASEITSIPTTSFQVLIKEYPVENWGIGGTPLGEILKNR